ncbi:thiamine biosynthesis protein ThiW [miscellaneous Crenarchaeota group-15 archaeon DG-45]|uniref:Thiamine biosynthesis protein ThiW n=1 Tax=miscellaneous Crenarchaeota group-15 archaeon DG-45 TaxID=1685127 RepID=A0A0M0BMR5_9ARCH|nr:MAG: thiamine biosynthesis protein ThiW [miscellaneous Crenarchaeota group-15 archaeon DG-45]
MFSTRKISLATVLIALGVAISPFLWFPILASKAFPGQHIVNAVAGVLLGPFWAALIALCIGLIRMSLGIGTLFSMPGGIPGALVVGLFHWLLGRGGVRRRELAALTEPLGTVLIGGTLAVYLVAPYVGREMLLIPVWMGWALSSVPGAVVGLIILEALRAAGFTRETFAR